MKVKALHTINQYYRLTAGGEYEVIGIIYFATPFMGVADPNTIDKSELRTLVAPIWSLGVIRNELVYVVNTVTETGRSVWMRFNAANFEVIDPTVPDGWKVDVIDLHDEVTAINTPEESSEVLSILKGFNAKIIAIGDETFRTLKTLYAICDDDMNSEDS